MGMFSQKEILLMIGVVSVLLICITILTIIDIKDYLKAKKGLIKEDLSLEKEFEEENNQATYEPIKVMEVEEEQEPNILIKEEKPIVKENVFFEEMEDEKFAVESEVNPIMEEEEEFVPQVKKTEIVVPQVEVEETKIEVPEAKVKEEKKLDVFEELEETINNLPNKKDDITNFEAEQERTAIISLDELMKKSDELYNDNEIVQYDDGNEPISIDEVIRMFNREEDNVHEVVSKVEKTKEKSEELVSEVKEISENIIEEKIPYSKKETIPFISSVYGIEKDNALEFENTATYEKLDRENYNDFVSKLKEMNENK